MIENCRFASFPCDMDWIMMKETPFEKTKCLIILSEDIMNRGESIAIIATPLAHIWLKHDVSYLAPRDSEGDFDQKQFDRCANILETAVANFLLDCCSIWIC